MKKLINGIGQLLRGAGSTGLTSGDKPQTDDEAASERVEISAMDRAMEEAIRQRQLEGPVGPRVMKVPRPRNSASTFGRRNASVS